MVWWPAACTDNRRLGTDGAPEVPAEQPGRRGKRRKDREAQPRDCNSPLLR